MKRTRPIVAIILGLAIFMRLYELGRLPGVNGDEAWYGANVLNALLHKSYTLRTPTHNLASAFHVGLLWLLHAVVRTPSVVMLRLPAVISGVATILLAAPLLRRRLGATTAAVAALFIACMPAHIASARFGWDPSHAHLIGLLFSASLLAGRLLIAAVCFFVAISVHPTNVFLAPLYAGACLGMWLELDPERRQRLRQKASLALLGGLLLLLAFTLWMPDWYQLLSFDGAVGRIATIPSLGLMLFGRLLSGITFYQYIVGRVGARATAAHDLIFGVVFLLLAVAGTRALWRQRRLREVGFSAGIAVSLFFLCFITWSEALGPSQCRYALFFTVPCAIAMAFWLTAARPIAEPTLRGFGPALAISLAWLVSFGVYYLVALERGGSDAHETFHTGPVEPKVAAFAFIAREVGPAPVEIIAENYWCYWSFLYLAELHPNVSVRLIERDDELFAPPLTPGAAAYTVGFANGPIDTLSRQRSELVPVLTLRANDGVQIFHVFRRAVRD